ncbi:MAG: hypothetical protein C0597_07550, partial [Marinilabiliales bacterium]
KASKLSKSNSTIKVLYFEKLLNFIRALCLYIISNNDLQQILTNWNIKKEGGCENRIIESFIDLLFHFDILKLIDGKLALSKRYDRLLKNEKTKIQSLFKDQIVGANFKKPKLIIDFLFVKDLINRYRNATYDFKHIKRNKKTWIEMIQDGTLDYEIRLAETLFEISRLKIPNKIKSPFTEDYYTESGRNAFKNFTQYKFIDVFTKIVEKRENINVLDIGCGYGNYIDVLNTNYPMFHILGIETQEKVFEFTNEKFKQTNNVDILHGDFFNYPFQNQFDIILLNYVLFYFNRKEKSDLLAKAKQVLSEDGSIIVCQYFANIENIKRDLAERQNELSLSKQIEMFYSNKILYANTLWNDVADTFSESVKWDEFLDIIAENNLKINRITNADKFYYSLFIELTPNK